jgi:hypothetical protein
VTSASGWPSRKDRQFGAGWSKGFVFASKSSRPTSGRGQPLLLTPLAHQFQIVRVILFTEKRRLASVAALDDMVGKTFDDDSCDTSHEVKLPHKSGLSISIYCPRSPPPESPRIPCPQNPSHTPINLMTG